MKKTRILHIIDSLTVGGAEKLLVATINSLPGYDHHLIYLGGSDKLLPEIQDGCKIIKLYSTSKKDIPYCIYKVRQYIRQNQIQVVHSHLVMATLVARMACPAGVKLFNTLHSLVGSRFFGPGKKALRLLERATYKKRHHIIAVSEEVLRDYDRIIGLKGEYTLLPNFIGEQYFGLEYKKSSFSENLKLVTVGSLKPAKNYKYLLEAFKELPKTIQLDIYGEGPARRELQSLIDASALNIRLCGAVKNANEILGNYDLFVMSSSFEGHPLALLEAMAWGMPAAVSDIPVLREATGNKGIYFDLNNTGDFIDKIKAIAGHQVDLDEYARHNFGLAKNAATRTTYMKSLSQVYYNRVETHKNNPGGKLEYVIR